MIGEGLGKKVAAAAVVASAAAVTCVAGGYGLYAIFREFLDPPWAAFLTAAVFAVVAWIAAGVMRAKARSGEPRRESGGPFAAFRGGGSHESGSMTERLADLARERPLMAGAAAVAAGFLVLRNPALVAIVTAALSERNRRR